MNYLNMKTFVYQTHHLMKKRTVKGTSDAVHDVA